MALPVLGIPALTMKHLHFASCTAECGLAVSPDPVLLRHIGGEQPRMFLSTVRTGKWMSAHHPQAPALAVHT